MYFVYIITNYTNTTFYVGVTNDLQRRILQHKSKILEGFSSKYCLKKLVYIEEFKNVNDAIYREKQLKKYRRSWKFNLIRENNPSFDDLSTNWFEESDAGTSPA